MMGISDSVLAPPLPWQLVQFSVILFISAATAPFPRQRQSRELQAKNMYLALLFVIILKIHVKNKVMLNYNHSYVACAYTQEVLLIQPIWVCLQ